MFQDPGVISGSFFIAYLPEIPHNLGIMKKNQYKSYSKKNGRNARDRRKRKKEDSRLVGFTTLSQVVGAPKPHSYHSHLPVEKSRIIKEPFETCAICSQRIDNIAMAMISADNRPVHFDCVLEELKKAYPLRDGQIMSYCGKGSFAIFEKDEEGRWITVQKIPYEDAERYARSKSYVEENKI